jgi:hypothetical protein
MENQIKVELCKICSGKGILPTGSTCYNCSGSGVTGSDGVYQYYLERTSEGMVKVVGMKSSNNDTSSQKADIQPSPSQSSVNQRYSVMKGLVLVLLILLYAGFLGIHFALLRNMKVFWTVTIIALGFMSIFILYNTRLVNKLIFFLMHLLLQEPHDYLSGLRKLKSAKRERNST